MFYQFSYWLLKMKLSQPSEKVINYWVGTNSVNKLEYALTHGNYKTRQLAAEALEFVGQPTSIPILLIASVIGISAKKIIIENLINFIS